MSEHRPGAKERNRELVMFAVNAVSGCDICSCGVQMFGRCLPIEVLPSGDSQRASVSARTEQHVATVWVSLQKDFSLCSRHRAKTPACHTHILIMVMHTKGAISFLKTQRRTHGGISPTKGTERGEGGARVGVRVLRLDLSLSTTSFSICSWPGSNVRQDGTFSWDWDRGKDIYKTAQERQVAGCRCSKRWIFTSITE